jgi:hypothetical protein
MLEQDQQLRHALSLMEAALTVIDQTDASHVGAHLDLAICRVQELLNTEVRPHPAPPNRNDMH